MFRTGKLLGVAVILSTMIAADADARRGGRGGFHGGRAAFRAGGFHHRGFARARGFRAARPAAYRPRAFRRGFAARPYRFRRAAAYRPRAYRRAVAYRPYAFRRAAAYRPRAYRRAAAYRPYAYRRAAAYRPYRRAVAHRRAVAYRRAVAHRRAVAYRRSVAHRRAVRFARARQWAWNQEQWRRWSKLNEEQREKWRERQEELRDEWRDEWREHRKDWRWRNRPVYFSNYNYYYGGRPYYHAAPRAYTYAVAGSPSVEALQQRLRRAGYYSGPIDGVIGPRTRSAIVRFARDHGLPATASITRPLLISLGLA